MDSTVSKLMTRTVLTCGPDKYLDKPAMSMWDYDCGAIPVVNDDRQVIGMLTDVGLALAAICQPRSSQQMPIG